MAVTLTKGHISRALDFYKKNIYFGIGRQTPWDDESTPPEPYPDDFLENPLVFKRAESVFMVVPDTTGELIYRNTAWKIVDPTEALEKGARWVYVSTNLSYEEVATNISYRQVCIFTDMVPIAGAESEFVLTPDKIQDYGIPQVLDNRKPVYREPDMKEKLSIVIEF